MYVWYGYDLDLLNESDSGLATREGKQHSFPRLPGNDKICLCIAYTPPFVDNIRSFVDELAVSQFLFLRSPSSFSLLSFLSMRFNVPSVQTLCIPVNAVF